MFIDKKINIDKIITEIDTKWVAKKIKYFETIDSTNLEAKRAILNGDFSSGTVFITEEQTAGKGRLGRKWVSQKGNSVLMSLVVSTEMDNSNIFKITMICGLAVLKAISNITGLEAKIKWPNDIVIDNKKVCGILCELIGVIDSVKHIIIGIGINVNDSKFPSEVENIATSLKIATQKIACDKGLPFDTKINREDLIIELFKQLEEYLNIYTQEENEGYGKKVELLDLAIMEYKKHCITLNNAVRLIYKGDELTGRAIDINQNGELIVLVNNEILTINTGDVSVRGLYDYV